MTNSNFIKKRGHLTGSLQYCIKINCHALGLLTHRLFASVMLFPDTADRSWSYSTTNGQYGNFYGTVIPEVSSLAPLLEPAQHRRLSASWTPPILNLPVICINRRSRGTIMVGILNATKLPNGLNSCKKPSMPRNLSTTDMQSLTWRGSLHPEVSPQKCQP